MPLVALPPPRIGTIYLDCTPLGTDDVRDASRTQADALTGLTEAIGTDGGAVTRLAAEMLGQRHQWASGRFPFLQVRWDDFDYKFDQVMREKIGGPGVSTQLIKDQYGVIRRLDMSAIAGTLAPGTRIVYFLPATPTDDRTVRVEQVQDGVAGIGDLRRPERAVRADPRRTPCQRRVQPRRPTGWGSTRQTASVR